MGLKKRNKVSAQFNMSSLTDIIFLLLIFFMLTSSLVAPNALNLKLPGSSTTARVPSTPPDNVRITQAGNYYFRGRRISLDDLDTILKRAAERSSKKLNITIDPAPGAPVEYVVNVMDIAMRYDINGILAVEKR
ncbi:MAG: biopolymer transporter ExbD [Bacteroidota bacterium]